MNLHEDNDVFLELIAVAAENIGLPQIYVEKDYWVTKALKKLSESKYAADVVFKGGTSLSKAYRLIDRFSEDIDLAVLVGDRNNSAQKKLIKGVESAASEGLVYLSGDERESKGSKYRKTVYQYPRSIDGSDFGQASPELLIEVNAFANPEPCETKELESFVAQVLDERGEQGLIAQYGLEVFSINVLSVRRTLVEKMLGVIKDSYHENATEELSGRIRHLYDICLILREDEHRKFIESDEFMPLCKACIADEEAGYFGSTECYQKPLSSAPVFSDFETFRVSLETTYKGVFSGLVYGELPEMDEIERALKFLKEYV